MNKKIWLIGAKGMLGSTIEGLLEDAGIECVSTDREIDITHLTELDAFAHSLKNITHIINCAAYTQVDAAESHREEAYQLNAIGIENIAIVSNHLKARVLHFSTDYVFNGEADKPYLEDHLCEPVSVYGHGKWEGEQKLFQQKPNACMIRTSWLYGLSGKHFVQTMLRLMAEREELRVVNDQFGRPTYCPDLAEATLSLLDCSGIYHFANEGETTWYLFAKKIHEEAQKYNLPLKLTKLVPITTSEYPTPARRPHYSILNTQKIEKELKKPPRHWHETLQDYFSKTFEATPTH